jgi:hypothetical protein
VVTVSKAASFVPCIRRILITGFCLTGFGLVPINRLAAQAPPGPYGTAAPPAVWIATPCPSETVWVIPAQPMTTYYLPAEGNWSAAGDLSADSGIASQSAFIAPVQDMPFRVTVAESFLTRLMGREVTDAGPVRDCFLGADVFGNQFTLTQLSIDCQPCATQARVLLRLVGSISDSTVGVTRPAAVRSDGNHQFHMTKQVDFDGRQFTTRSPAAWVSTQIIYRGASTVVSGVPVLGPIGSSIALSQAERRRPVAVQYATRRITEMAAPRFNDEVDKNLSKANHQLAARSQQFFQAIGLSPADQVLTTADDRLCYGLRIPSPPLPSATTFSGPVLLGTLEEPSLEMVSADAALSLDAPAFADTIEVPVRSAPPTVQGSAATILIHQDFVNHLLDSQPLGGREIPDRQIEQLTDVLREAISRRSLGSLSFDLGEPSEPEFATVLLSQERPLSIRFADGELIVTLQAGFRPQVGGVVPTQRIEIPFRLAADDDQLRLEPGEVSVTAATEDEGGPLVALARPIIQQQVTERLQPMQVPRTIPLSLPDTTPTTLAVRDVMLADGWLAITLD